MLGKRKLEGERIMIAFDTETTGLDAENDEIVSASIVREDNGIIATEWLLKTSIESTDEALSKHGITFEKTQKEGEDYVESIEDIASRLLDADYVVTANGVFDMTMLQGSLDRFSDKEWDMSSVKMVDIMVIDKFIDKYRKGPRKLENLRDRYGVSFDGDLHDATSDSIITFFIFIKQLKELKATGYSLQDTPSLCELEYGKQKDDLINYFNKVGRKATVSLGYPVSTGSVKIG